MLLLNDAVRNRKKPVRKRDSQRGREREWRNQVPLSVFGLAANETRFQMDMEIKWMPRFIKSTKNKKK